MSSAIRLTSQWLAWMARDVQDMSYPADDAAELDDAAIAGTLDDAAVMHCDSRIDQVAAKGPEASKDSIFIRTRKPRVADDVGHQDRRQLPGLAHSSGTPAIRIPSAKRSRWARNTVLSLRMARKRRRVNFGSIANPDLTSFRASSSRPRCTRQAAK